MLSHFVFIIISYMLFYYIVFFYTYAIFYYDYGILLYGYRFVYVMLQVFLGYVIALRAPRQMSNAQWVNTMNFIIHICSLFTSCQPVICIVVIPS